MNDVALTAHFDTLLNSVSENPDRGQADYLGSHSDLRRLFIVGSANDAFLLNQRFREDRNLAFVAPFSCRSYRADVVIWTIDPWENEYPTEVIERWISEWVECRLMPDNHGQVFLDHIPGFIVKALYQ